MTARKRTWRKIKCFFGNHGLDCIREEGDLLVQRCLYCDKVVVKFENRNMKIRRVK